MDDIAEFLRTQSPFDSLDEETLAAVADSAEIEFYAARTVILDSADVAEFAYVVRRGSVELVIDGSLLDLIPEGEIFGYVSLLSEGPLGFVACAAEDTLVYRIPADVIAPVLERPAFVRFVTRVMNERLRFLAGHQPEPPLSSVGRPVGELIRAPALSVRLRPACRRRIARWPRPARPAWWWS
jgi:CBS domain-containing protein